jgi:hypothetical protein
MSNSIVREAFDGSVASPPVSFVAARLGAAILPDDRAVKRLAAVRIPDADGLTLIGDADGLELPRLSAGLLECLAGHGLRHLPDLCRVVLHPAGPREVPFELPVGSAQQFCPLVEDQARRARRALIDGQDHDVGNLVPRATGILS